MDHIGSIFYCIYLPLTTIFTLLYSCFLVALAPLLHLASYALSAALLPVKFLAKFETLYIYLGVAAVIGLLTGAILYVSSSILMSIFNLASTTVKQTPDSAKAVRGYINMESAWQSLSSRGEGVRLGREFSLERQFTERQAKNDGRLPEQGLSSQTILEEDDSDDF
ncbi:hypothetical protein BJ878DRAFT_122024 [Calycina marina]|uniref:Uncharacterized protein n=1 Tax=Calycina marina TaxID=1763456 RepID=A0A9P8CI23_9HELO|nr:hypothetical protein BJ878DRAFT_122024 [Calycina marina]